MATNEMVGRLFFTQEERGFLDARRAANQQKEIEVLGRSQEMAGSEKVVDNTVMQGYVERSDDKNTIWVDGSALQEGGEHVFE